MKLTSASRLAIALLGALAAGCNAQDSGTISEIGPGSLCANGGVIVTSGGVSQTICNGANGTDGADGGDGAPGPNGPDGGDGAPGYDTLIATTALPVGDANCPAGGEEVQTGLDDGANGGTANDGILQLGEVLTTSYLCNGQSGGYQVGATTPPPGAAAGYTILARGGDGLDGGAGSGGLIRAQISNGTQGGHLEVFNTGAADPSFTFPALPAFDPGAQPAVISSSVTLHGYSGDLGVGDLYVADGGELMVLLDPADGGAALATSLTIAAGAVVSVVPAEDDAGPGAACALDVAGPIVNAGELTTPPGQGGALYVTAANYFGAQTSSIVNDGADSSSSGGIHLSASAIWNQGALSANGGAGASGGAAGPIYLTSVGNGGIPIFNTGAISARGGAGTDGPGGSGGRIELDGTGDIDNAGALDSSGGDGTLGGGSAGPIFLEAAQSNLGSVRNSGALSANGGGGCTAATEGTCAGGNGSVITLYGQNGILSSNGPLSATGGSVGAAIGGQGGNGGEVSIESADIGAAYSGENSNYLVPSGDLNLSGNIDVSGGTGWTGGEGGIVAISLDPRSQPNGQQVILYGYATLDTSGGDGQGSGGVGGQIQLSNAQYSPPEDNSRALAGSTSEPAPGGSVINYADCLARGGRGASGAGGAGGFITLFTGTQAIFADDTFENVVSSATLDASSGDGASGGENPEGGINVNALTGAVLSGHLLARGGAGSGSGDFGVGGAAGTLYATSVLGTLTDAAIGDFSGGGGSVSAGSGSSAYLSSAQVVFSGSLSVNGGAGTAAGAGAGNGGDVFITSNGGAASQIEAAAPGGIAVSAGAAGSGGAAGTAGHVLIDAFEVTSSWTH